jgi:Listeria-Bacteroides repeat domain (List_Bact_rpt)
MAYTVTYNANGATGGAVPVDPQQYAANQAVTVLGNTGNLVQAGGSFAYWNTAADGSGTLYGSGNKFDITSDVTLYAQWYVTAGLTNGGVTSHYAFSYDSALSAITAANPAGLEPARTNGLIAACESDYDLMASWFGGISLPFSTPVSVQVANRGGGAGWGPPITLKPGGGDVTLCRYLMVSEVTEMFMLSQHQGWFAPDGSNEQSCGEGLSRFLAQQFLEKTGLGTSMPGYELAPSWLNSSLPSKQVGGFDYGARADYVNNTLEYDHGIDPATGCAILFIYYLYVQLDFSIEEIVKAAPGVAHAASCLAGVYHNLTADAGDPFPAFKQLLDSAYPPDVRASIAGPNPDNPFPLGEVTFWVDKSTFGRDEVQDVIATGGGEYPDAFWVVVEGFSANSFNELGVVVPTPTGSLADIDGIAVAPSADPPDFENAANPKAPQRIRVAYDIDFSDPALSEFPVAGAPPAVKDLQTGLSIGGTAALGAGALAGFELLAGADPYFTNINPAQENVFYLSQDLRVFTAVPGLQPTPVTGGPFFATDSPAGAYAYVQALLAHLNANFQAPSGPDPFTTVLPDQQSALADFSSVAPYTLDLSDIFDPKLLNNYSFAIARVRLRGQAGPLEAAENVRVFFRVWSAQSPDTAFDEATAYPSTLDAATQTPISPLVGADQQTLPFFATGDLAANTDYGDGGANNRTIEIVSGDDIWAYYGCFLNLYDPANTVDGYQVQHWLAGTHHCIVAQIAYADAPIVNEGTAVASPENSDKLAQRNLQITHSDNPGAAASHRIPQAFDIRPGAPLTQPASPPDELMIDWGSVPAGSLASIYWPAVDAAEVLALAAAAPGSERLTALDAHTIRCAVTGGVTYLPVPPGTGENYAGLFTIDLPSTVVRGQEFDVVVRRIATHTRQEVIFRPRSETTAREAPDGEAPDALQVAAPPAAAKPPTTWRYVVGTFQVKIPVSTKDALLAPEESALAVLRWRLQSNSPASRWHPVLERYVSYIADRVEALGGDPATIAPSLQGAPAPTASRPTPGRGSDELTGVVVSVHYDCFGHFEGFVIGDCSAAERSFRSREPGLGELVLRCFKERLRVTVVFDRAGYGGGAPEPAVRRLIVHA